MNTKTRKPILVDFNTLSSRRPLGTYAPSVPTIAPAAKVFGDNPGRSASEVAPTGDVAAEAPKPAGATNSDD